jgi:hypothetical protein
MSDQATGSTVTGEEPVALTPQESIPLLSAWVSRLGQEAGIRLLVIKGPVAALQGLRVERESGDVDVWVEPSRRDDYVERLKSFDWYVLVNDRPTILPVHAVTMRHDRWACELDVHDRFPGFFADRGEVFDRLWEQRAIETVAGAPVATLSRAANAVVLALHLLRDLRPGRPREELTHLVGTVGGFTADERRVVTELIAGCGANETAAPFLREAGLTPLPATAVPGRDLRDWHLMTNTHGAPTVYWVHRLSRTSWWRWPAVLWRSFWMTDEQIRQAEPTRDSSQRSLMGARLRRLRRGLGMLPQALRMVRSRSDGG